MIFENKVKWLSIMQGIYRQLISNRSLLQMRKVILILAILSLALAATSNATNTLWPRPINYTYTPEGPNVTVSPCDIKYVVSSPGQLYVEDMINLYLIQVFKCAKVQPGKIVLNVVVKTVDPLIPTDLKHEKYLLIIRESGKWQLSADYYPGFLRGLETFSQIFEKNEKDEYEVFGLPISISDAPQYLWRGLMIDTSRHFLPVSAIKHAIDGMMYSKLNVLHWHITDEDAFPLYVPTLPELSESGSIGGVYSEVDVKSIITYAKARGIRVIPEIDTPAHTQSWGRSEKYKYITLNCDGVYQGQLDPTINMTWDVITGVLKYVNSTFNDDYVHFGGDEVDVECWGERPRIVQWMKANNVSTFKDLAIYFRKQQKKLWRTISAKKKVIYWANVDIDLPVDEDDVIQWWGESFTMNKLAGRKNPIILSTYDQTYLDIGFGDQDCESSRPYQNWTMAYSFEPKVTNVNVIGGTSCMWNEIGNLHTFDQKVIQKSSIIGERLWNSKMNIKTDIRNIAARLTAHSQRLRDRGFKVWPIASGFCQNSPQLCF